MYLYKFWTQNNERHGFFIIKYASYLQIVSIFLANYLQIMQINYGTNLHTFLQSPVLRNGQGDAPGNSNYRIPRE